MSAIIFRRQLIIFDTKISHLIINIDHQPIIVIYFSCINCEGGQTQYDKIYFSGDLMHGDIPKIELCSIFIISYSSIWSEI